MNTSIRQSLVKHSLQSADAVVRLRDAVAGAFGAPDILVNSKQWDGLLLTLNFW